VTVSHDSTERISRLQARMAEMDVDLTAIAPTASMRYLIGFAPLMDERPCALLVSQQDTRLVVPELNADQVEARTGMEAIRWPDAAGPRQALTEALNGLGIKPGRVLAADDSMRADSLILLQEMADPKRSLAAGGLIGALRVRKSEAELDALAHAAAMADETLMIGADACRPGVTEREIAEVITGHFRHQGAEMVDFIIVASGPNGAFPHHEVGDRRLEEGDTIIIDIGATFNGYKSDVTRVVHLGEPPDEVRAIYEAVLEANRLGRKAAVAGARALDVDRAAREALEKAGYGPYFTHRTGHGLGLEIHEPPWITAGNDAVLEPGMVFSIEPGVYLPGKFGIRIEDIVAVTQAECRCLTGLDHALIVKT
jgi:Xaa-Pro aminopeptidase